MSIPIKTDKKILIFGGGGVKGISYIGVLKYLEETSIIKQIETFAGTSIGGLMIVLHLLGYSSGEIYDFFCSFDLSKLKSDDILDIFSKYGIDNGKRLVYVLIRLFISKGYNPNITLKEFYQKTNKKLIMVTTCLNTISSCYLSYESHPDLPVILAVRMTTSIPIIFAPVTYQSKLYVDGGCVDNYPIQIFEDQLPEVIGIFINEIIQPIAKIENIEQYLMTVINCLKKSATMSSINGYQKYTIILNIDNVGIYDLDISQESKDILIKTGYDTMCDELLKLC